MSESPNNWSRRANRCEHHARVSKWAGRVLAAGLASLASYPAYGECPLNTIICLDGDTGYDDTYYSSDATAVFHCGEYDLARGTLGIGAGSYFYGHGRSGRVETSDTYDVVGVASGTNLAVDLELHLVGSLVAKGGQLYCGHAAVTAGALEMATQESVGFSASIYARYDPEEYFCYFQEAAIDSVLRMTIPVVAGESFALRVWVGASGNDGVGNLTGSLLFRGLPPGATIVSCQGFVQEGPVQALSSSWGRVKAHFR